MKKVCVFCGSKSGSNPLYKKITEELGKILATNDITLVYGGGGIGLMGILADTVIKNNGNVIGVIPRFLSDKELGHKQINELILVDSMHERKQRMAELADAFIALPGGFGTLEELCEILTWRQLKLIKKPVGLLNETGFFDHLLYLFDHMIREGFLKKENKDLLITDKSPEQLINRLNKKVVRPGEKLDKT